MSIVMYAQETNKDSIQMVPVAVPDSGMTGPLYEAVPLVADSSKPTVIDSLPKDTTISASVLRKHSAGRAAWMSAILPGLGQGYNRKYWKIPIVYAGFAGLGYAVYYTATNFNQARNAYRDAVDGNSTTNRTYKGISGSAELKTYRDYFNRYLNLACIFTVVWYGLNIIDATVDGHLYHYNMNDKLSFSVDPDIKIQNNFGTTAQSVIGLKLSLKL